MLTSFCRLAISHLRPNDLFGRIGGEEFAGLLPDTGNDDASGSPSGFAVPSKPLPRLWTDAIGLTVSVGDAISDEEFLISARYSMRAIELSIARGAGPQSRRAVSTLVRRAVDRATRCRHLASEAANLAWMPDWECRRHNTTKKSPGVHASAALMPAPPHRLSRVAGASRVVDFITQSPA